MWPFAKGEESAKSLIKERWTQERYEAGEKITFPRLSLNPTEKPITTIVLLLFGYGMPVICD